MVASLDIVEQVTLKLLDRDWAIRQFTGVAEISLLSPVILKDLLMENASYKKFLIGQMPE